MLSQNGEFSFSLGKIEVLLANIIHLKSHAMILDFWFQIDMKYSAVLNKRTVWNKSTGGKILKNQ